MVVEHIFSDHSIEVGKIFCPLKNGLVRRIQVLSEIINLRGMFFQHKYWLVATLIYYIIEG